MRNITVCFTYFRSLTLANLDAALHSVRQQDLSRVREIVIVDNDTTDDEVAIQDVIESFGFPVPTRLLSMKHGDRTRTHAWSSNLAVREATTPWVLFARADYVLDFRLLRKFEEHADRTLGWNAFTVSNGCHLHVDVERCEATNWRDAGPNAFSAFSKAEFDYTKIDAGVWMGRKDAYEAIGGLDERLTAWGHAQTDFQHRLHESGVEFARIPEVLFWHPAHGGEKDIELAHRQLAAAGGDLKRMWARYEGVSPYGN